MPQILHRLIPLLALLAGLCAEAAGQGPHLPSAAPGIVENGAPRFTITTSEAIGLLTSPTDLTRLPDGRLVVVSENQIALGDGQRWEVYHQAPDHLAAGPLRNVLVDHEGRLYAARGNTIGRVDFGQDGFWRMTIQAEFANLEKNYQAGLAVGTELGNEWLWHGLSGTVARWRPGTPLVRLGVTNVASHLFSLNGSVYLSDSASGSLYRIRNDTLTPVTSIGASNPGETITGSAPLDATRCFVGTFQRGLRIFDGTTLHETAAPPPLAGSYHIRSLCAVDGGFYAAAVANVGILFFDREARVVCSLGTLNDHRFAHVLRLVSTNDGYLWALLREGVARIHFPAPITDFDGMIDTGLSYAIPLRHEGKLWLCGDGLAQRGLYTPEGRLLGFKADSPPGRYVVSMCSLEGTGILVAGTDQGVYAFQDGQWKLVINSLLKARVINVRGETGRWFYAARNTVGWLVLTPDGLRTEGQSTENLENVYDMLVDDSMTAWLELGTGHCARVDLTRPSLTVEHFTHKDGLDSRWVQCFLYHGKLRVNVGGKIKRFDEATRRFEPDTDIVSLFPSRDGYRGRGAFDSSGRFWISTPAGLTRWDASGMNPRVIQNPAMKGELPYYIIPEDSGVMWLHSDHHLQRYDPSVPEAPPPPLRILLTRVSKLAGESNLRVENGRLPAIPHSENSLSFHFAATGVPLGETVGFEALLEGVSKDWAPTGSTGTITFNKLHEGAYLLHVRPSLTRGSGEEITIAFSVLPPWYRSIWAYLAYALASLALVALSVRTILFLQHRDRQRLENLVFQRTAQLNETNHRLAEQVNHTILKAQELQESEERVRRLNEELEKRVLERTAELNEANGRLRDSNRELESFSYSVSHDLQAPLRNISGFAELLQRKAPETLSTEQRRYIDTVASEAARLGELIRSLLNFSRIKRSELRRRPTSLGNLVSAVRTELAGDCADRPIEWRVGELPTMEVDPILMHQVFANLIGNAVKFTRHRKPAIIEIGVQDNPELPGFIVFSVRDNGAGFDPKYSDKLFGVFQRLHHPREFEGTGIGLANVRQIVTHHGGKVWAEGRVDAGATFFFSLPKRPRNPAA